MKIAAIISLLAVTVDGFAPSLTTSTRASVSSLAATAELDGLVGIDIESGKKIVRRVYRDITSSNVHPPRQKLTSKIAFFLIELKYSLTLLV
jgi:hypothetical protein